MIPSYFSHTDTTFDDKRVVLVPDMPRQGNLFLYKMTSIKGGSPEYLDTLPDGLFSVANGSFSLNGCARQLQDLCMGGSSAVRRIHLIDA